VKGWERDSMPPFNQAHGIVVSGYLSYVLHVAPESLRERTTTKKKQ